MSNYTKSTDFASKDTLPSGDSAKIVRGTEIDAEFEALETAVNSKYDSSSTIAVANGGTGATTASGARTNLGLVIGTDVQAYDADLTTWAGKTAPTGDVVGTSDTQTLTNKTLASPIINGMGSSVITSGTSVASTSGTSIDFTSIPSWVKRITVMLNGVSTNGSSVIQIQLGAGSVTTSGYVSGASYGGGGNTSFSTTGLGVTASGTMSSSVAYSGLATICLLGSNTWCESGTMAPPSTVASSYSAGSIALSGTLDRIRITTVNGTDTFGAGSINIIYE